jgi:hypothetical protein
MTEHHEYAADDGAADGSSGWRGRAGGIARAAAAVAAGVTVGLTTHDVGLGITTAAAAVSILREVFARPGR